MVCGETDSLVILWNHYNFVTYMASCFHREKKSSAVRVVGSQNLFNITGSLRMICWGEAPPTLREKNSTCKTSLAWLDPQRSLARWAGLVVDTSKLINHPKFCIINLLELYLEMRCLKEDVLAVHVDDLLLLASSVHCSRHLLQVDLQHSLMICCVSGRREP